MLALLLILACGDGAEDTAADRAAISRADFVRRFGPAWCAAQAGCVADVDDCAHDQSAIIDEWCEDYSPAAGAACIEALEDVGPGGMCEVYPSEVSVPCGAACGW